MELILSRENILLAYRNIKANSGSKTAGTDKLTIDSIGRMSAEKVVEKVRFIISGTKHGYRPKPVRRKEMPKLNGTTRPLGIPCIWDRLVQQCIRQILDPVCEAKFSHNSYGFRPNRSAKNAMRRVYNLMQLSRLHYVAEFDIKGFFDNVNHSKLIRQIWGLGIRDKHLIYLIKQILKTIAKLFLEYMYSDEGIEIVAKTGSGNFVPVTGYSYDNYYTGNDTESIFLSSCADLYENSQSFFDRYDKQAISQLCIDAGSVTIERQFGSLNASDRVSALDSYNNKKAMFTEQYFRDALYKFGYHID